MFKIWFICLSIKYQLKKPARQADGVKDQKVRKEGSNGVKEEVVAYKDVPDQKWERKETHLKK